MGPVIPIIGGKVAIDLAVLAGVVQAAQIAALLAGIGAFAFNIARQRERVVFSNSSQQRKKYEKMVDEIAKRSYNQDEWTYSNLRKQLTKGTHEKAKHATGSVKYGDIFVPSQKSRPHFHIGDNFICLTTVDGHHNYLVNSSQPTQNNRTPENFFNNLHQCTNEEINEIIKMLQETLRNCKNQGKFNPDSDSD